MTAVMGMEATKIRRSRALLFLYPMIRSAIHCSPQGRFAYDRRRSFGHGPFSWWTRLPLSHGFRPRISSTSFHSSCSIDPRFSAPEATTCMLRFHASWHHHHHPHAHPSFPPMAWVVAFLRGEKKLLGGMEAFVVVHG